MNHILRPRNVLFISLMIPIMSFSQSTYKDTLTVLTPKELKTTNLIFAEHAKYKQENKVLKEEVNNYKSLVKNDSTEISIYSNENTQLKTDVKSLKKKLKIGTKISVVGGIALFLIGLFI
mgnify:CR=1 FL=1